MIRTENTVLLKRTDYIKRITLAIILMLSVIGLCVFNLIVINSKKNECSNILEETYIAAKSNNKSIAEKKLNSFTEIWNKNEGIMMLMLHRDDVDDVSFITREIKEYLKENEMPEFYAGLKRIMALLDHTFETEMPYPKNVF